MWRVGSCRADLDHHSIHPMAGIYIAIMAQTDLLKEKDTTLKCKWVDY